MMAGIITAVLFALFIGGWIWMWLPARRQEFEAAARIPLEDEETGA
jgi:cytochrome c oxidase cbb3-type subunit 4